MPFSSRLPQDVLDKIEAQRLQKLYDKSHPLRKMQISEVIKHRWVGKFMKWVL